MSDADTDGIYQVGDRVRDLAHLGGEVVQTEGYAVKVRWSNGTTGWVATRCLVPPDEVDD